MVETDLIHRAAPLFMVDNRSGDWPDSDRGKVVNLGSTVDAGGELYQHTWLPAVNSASINFSQHFKKA